MGLTTPVMLTPAENVLNQYCNLSEHDRPSAPAVAPSNLTYFRNDGRRRPSADETSRWWNQLTRQADTPGSLQASHSILKGTDSERAARIVPRGLNQRRCDNIGVQLTADKPQRRIGV